MNAAPTHNKELTNYQLGDVLGKGASGQVYRALNFTTGETVAVKQIQLANIPKAELSEIMSEIDLLRNLNHPNIVKYKGFVKTREYLNIILEYCENGSLQHICKRFGKFPENLVGVYISQVLEGLVYLHDQGVIHRDIKGANILTNKDGTVKLADFGVASATGVNDGAVVIEQFGATTASDIWSVGCVVIELLDGQPPYHQLKPMPALFRIVQDDCPPIPEGASPIVKDFLLQCFQKDPNLRISAKKLLRHPWMAGTRKQLGAGERTAASSSSSSSSTERPASNYGYDDAISRVLEWNEALRSPRSPSRRGAASATPGRVSRPHLTPFSVGATGSPMPTLVDPPSIVPSLSVGTLASPTPASSRVPGVVALAPVRLQPAVVAPEEDTDNWDDDFDIGESDGLNVTKLTPAIRAPTPTRAAVSVSYGLGVPHAEEENTRTIRPSRSSSVNSGSSGSQSGSFGRALAAHVAGGRPMAVAVEPIVEDWTSDLGGGSSDTATEDDLDTEMRAKVRQFKTRAASGSAGGAHHRGIFHPSDISLALGSPPRIDAVHAIWQPSTDAVHAVWQSRAESAPPRESGTAHRDGATFASSGSGSGTGSMGSRTLTRPGPSPRGSHSRSNSSYATFSSSLGRAEARKMSPNGGTSVPQVSLNSPTSDGLERYTEDEDDEDYDVVFAKPLNGQTQEFSETLQLNQRLSNKSWLGDEAEEPDIFADIVDDDFADLEDDLESNLVRDKFARLCNTVNNIVDALKPEQPDYALRDACDQLAMVITDAPDMKSQFVSSHGMLAVLEVLEAKPNRDVILKLLQITNVLVTDDLGILESFCSIGGIPVVMEFTSKKFSFECRQQASDFIRMLCHSSALTLQMFISCRGLKYLVNLLDESYAEQTELVVHALNGISSVFELQMATTKNDFCRMFIREGLLDPLTEAMASAVESDAAHLGQIISILLVFCQVSQSDSHVRSALGTRKVVSRLLRACEVLEPEYLVSLLKAVKHLSMNSSLLDVLQNANAIEILIRIMVRKSSGSYGTEISNHLYHTLYNLCRLNKSRQEEAAQAGIIPCLKRVSETNSPLRQFALPILCDLASAGKACRASLWQHDGLQLYIKLLTDPYFQVSALDAIFSWLQDETARVEDVLTEPASRQALLKCFTSATANSFENILEPLLKMIRLSTSVALGLAQEAFFRRLVDRVSQARGKAVVRLNLLRILRAVCDVHPERNGLIEQFGLLALVERLCRQDSAVLVRELAREILPTLSRAPSPTKQPSAQLPSPILLSPKAILAPKKRSVRRAASEANVLVPAIPTSNGNGTPPGTIKGTSTARSRLRPASKTRTEDIWSPPLPTRSHSVSGSASSSRSQSVSSSASSSATGSRR
ncbi:hypothetical protein BKA62DRAFT_818558 [Auriculariales sp. MPI-PUGE-AT-0066]|nr:hypothetical protein BKA62DRAFT_818558 [Auriculariales sp. MPI-PUGE-AT-0066]